MFKHLYFFLLIEKMILRPQIKASTSPSPWTIILPCWSLVISVISILCCSWASPWWLNLNICDWVIDHWYTVRVASPWWVILYLIGEIELHQQHLLLIYWNILEHIYKAKIRILFFFLLLRSALITLPNLRNGVLPILSSIHASQMYTSMSTICTTCCSILSQCHRMVKISFC